MDRLLVQSPWELRCLRGAGPRRPTYSAYLRFRPRIRQRLVAGQSIHPVHRGQHYRLPRHAGTVHRTPRRRPKAAPQRLGGGEGAFSPRGDQLAYVRGPGTWYRKGYRGSSNDDIWICQADGTGNRRLTTFNGQDTSPTWSLDGRFLYYVSEYFGTPANIVKQEATGSSPPRPFTFHKDEAVRQARISANGEWIVYECGPDLWLTSTHEGAAPRRLAIEVHADDKTNPEEIRTFTNGASEYVLSPDEKHVIFALHGSLFLMPIELPGKPRRLTTTAASDHSVAWAPDGQKIAFLSDRNGHDNIYLLQPDDPVRPRLVGAQHFKVKQLTRTPELEQGLSFTPDGRRLAFLRSGQLWTMNFDGTDARVLVADKQVVDYEYTSDGRWLAYARMDGSFATEIYVMPAGGGPARNVSRYATHNSGLTWSRDGSKLAFISERRSSPSLYVMSMHKPPVTPGAGSGDIDWEDIHLRVTQPATRPVTSGAISPDGSRVAFRSSDRDGDDLWVASVTGGQLSRLTTGNLQPQQIEWSRRDPSLIYFRDNAGALRKVRTPQGSVESLPFNVKMTICREEEFTEMFDQSWRGLAENFYDPHYHGADWDAVRARYRPLVKHVALKEDLYALISLMMGELNASHLGITGPVPKAEEETADLGLVFDETWRGPGVKIAAVVKRGPADRHGLDLRPGEYITAVDGTRLTERVNLSKLLNDKAGETVRVEVSRNASADPRDVKAVRSAEIRAVSREALRPLHYERWVEANARRVAELSQGKLGYIHIPSMDEAGLERFVRALYSDNFDKEGIILDVRFNGGGFTHDQVLNYLGAHEHTFFRQRYGGEGPVLRAYDRKWTRPLALLINNRSFSDAEIFPSAFKTLGLGKVIGQPTGAHVIGTGSIRLIDGSLFRIPRIGVFTVKGDDMEKVGVTPDVLVETHPDELARGRDVQLERAVEVLRHEVAAAPGRGGKPPSNLGRL